MRADYLNNSKNGGGLYGFNGYFIDEDGNTTALPGDDQRRDLGRNGIGPDLAGNLNRGANRYAVSVGLKYAVNPTTTFKVEYRLDGADRAVFHDVRNDVFRKQNHLLGTSLVVAF